MGGGLPGMIWFRNHDAAHPHPMTCRSGGWVPSGWWQGASPFAQAVTPGYTGSAFHGGDAVKSYALQKAPLKTTG